MTTEYEDIQLLSDTLTVPNSVIVTAGDYTRSTINKVIASYVEMHAARVYKQIRTKYPQYSTNEVLDLVRITLLMNKEKILSKFSAEDRDIVTLFLNSLQPTYKSAL